jgi:hypothetical protein
MVDIALVASILFVFGQALYQTRALQLLRGAITAAILGLVLLLLLPLDTLPTRACRPPWWCWWLC